jgi:arsenate reductase
VAQVLADVGIEVRDLFPKPVTDDAVQAADVIVMLANLPDIAPQLARVTPMPGVRWDVAAVDDAVYEAVEAVRDSLDRQRPHLLAEFPPVSWSDHGLMAMGRTICGSTEEVPG